jgi:hypothetical protein
VSGGCMKEKKVRESEIVGLKKYVEYVGKELKKTR